MRFQFRMRYQRDAPGDSDDSRMRGGAEQRGVEGRPDTPSRSPVLDLDTTRSID
jgi:hypothetical protein